jgi:uncharacterized membrane protein YphA (DoxX/SURF4 family)
MNTQSSPSKFFAYVAILVGGLLLLSGLAAAIGPVFLLGAALPTIGVVAWPRA